MRAQLGFDTTLHIRVEPELRQALDAAARKERTTPSEVVRRSLRAILASHSLDGAREHLDRSRKETA